MTSIFHGSRSSVVEMTLIAEGATFKVTHSFPDHLLLSDPVDLQPCHAKLTLNIDGESSELPFEIRTRVRGKRVDADFASEPIQVA